MHTTWDIGQRSSYIDLTALAEGPMEGISRVIVEKVRIIQPGWSSSLVMSAYGIFRLVKAEKKGKDQTAKAAFQRCLEGL